MKRDDKGVFVVIEGIDGVGKSSAINFIKESIGKDDDDVIFTSEPWQEAIKKAFKSAGVGAIKDDAHHSNMDRRLHVDQVIQPALERGAVVICDRYSWSFAAYQARGIYDVLKAYDSQMRMFPEPDLVILLTADLDTIMGRIRRRGGEKMPARRRIENLMANYGLLVLGECGASAIISTSNKSPEDVSIEIKNAIVSKTRLWLHL